MAEATKRQSGRGTRPPTSVVQEQRASFKALLATNLNYFGNLVDTPLKPVKKVVGDTTFEQLTCVGFNPNTNLLEATIEIKLPTGYSGDLCHAGSTEYVRFFLDYGSGWEDAGLAGVKVHDIPTGKDCASELDKPLTYVAQLKLKPKTDCCDDPVLPLVHAILSWQWIPPVGPANVGWQPVWGNALDCNIQIKPRRWDIFCLFEHLNKGLTEKIDIPPLFEQGKFQPIPLPDPPPLGVAELAVRYSAKTRAKAKEYEVEPHRFGLAELHPALSPSGFSQDLQLESTAAWDAIGLDWAQAVGALDQTKANVSYEELECIGLEEDIPERLVGTFRIKRPTGYSGELCEAGSVEYVAFWADWDNTCEWTYLGTATVNVHDFKTIPKQGLCYSAILPVDLTYHRRGCRKPKIARVRAVLSWAVPPSTTDPDALNYWGNRLDTHVQINPGDVISDGPLAKIRNIGGIAVEDIDTAATGMTTPGAIFAHHVWATADGWGLGRACPFGGIVEIEGYFFLGYYYRLRVHKVGDPPTVFTVLTDSFSLERWDIGFDPQAPVANGFFAYKDPSLYADIHLGYWASSHDDLWDVTLDIATAPNEASIVATSTSYRVQLDNTAPAPPPEVSPTIDIHIAAGGDCKDFDQGVTVTGTFVADDLHFGGWALSTEPNTFTTPSNQPQSDPFMSSTTSAPGPGGHGWKLDTGSPIAMKPCGYVVRLDVYDRTIVNSIPWAHNWNHIEVGLCLREKP